MNEVQVQLMQWDNGYKASASNACLLTVPPSFRRYMLRIQMEE